MRKSRIFQSRLRDRVLVTTKTGGSFAGVLYSEDGKALVLRDTTAIGAAEDRSDVPIDGELIVLLADVAYIQRP